MSTELDNFRRAMDRLSVACTGTSARVAVKIGDRVRLMVGGLPGTGTVIDVDGGRVRVRTVGGAIWVAATSCSPAVSA